MQLVYDLYVSDLSDGLNFTTPKSKQYLQTSSNTHLLRTALLSCDYAMQTVLTRIFLFDECVPQDIRQRRDPNDFYVWMLGQTAWQKMTGSTTTTDASADWMRGVGDRGDRRLELWGYMSFVCSALNGATKRVSSR
jgi:hypothetical protein